MQDKPAEPHREAKDSFADPQALLEAFDALADSGGVWEMLQEVATLVTSRVDASGGGVLQWQPDEEAFRLRAQYPTNPDYPLGPPDSNPQILPNAILYQVLESQDSWQGDFSALVDLGLEQALGLDELVGHALLKPVPYRGEVRGLALVWDANEERTFTNDETITLRVFLRHASIALENKMLLHEAKQSSEELEAIRQASLYLTSSLDLDEVLHAILESSLRLLTGVLDAHIFLYDGKTLSFGAAMWADGRKGAVWSEPRRDGLTYTVAESGEIVAVPNMQEHPLYEGAPKEWNGAIIGAPLRIANKVVGVMNVAYGEPREFSERELRLVTMLADHAAIAVHNARLHSLSQQEAHTDALTGLPNRRAFDERVEQEIRRSARYGHNFALVMMDLDGFKRVNDLHGHQMGDLALQDISRCLRYRVRDTDFLARFGGDEFVLILPETTGSDINLISDKLRTAVRECEIDWGDGPRVELSLSVGVANYPRDGEKAEDLVRVADQALYGHKGN